MDKEFHKNIIAHVDVMKTAGTISPDDSKLFFFTNNVDEAVTYIQKHTIKKYDLKQERKKLKPFKWLFESRW